MPPITPAALRQQLASGDTAPLFLLVGADDVEKSAMAGEFADAVDEGLRAFNVDRFYGGDIKVETLLDAAATLPMMVPRRVVIVFEAERLLVPKREGKAADADQEALERFIEAPAAHATVVFVCGTMDMRRRLSKLLVKQAFVVDCGTIVDAADAERWVRARAARDKVPLDNGAVRALVEHAGVHLMRLRTGLERVALYGLGQTTITADDVRQVVPATAEAANFGIANAIEQRDAATALRELQLALDGGAVPFFIMGQLRWVAEKMSSPKVSDAITAVFQTDLALKSSAGDPRVLLERLVVELCGPSARPRPNVRGR